MDYLVICVSALLVSGLTLFSGFGLGTLLLPVFALFFPVEVAVAAAAAVHLANNIFKAGLVGRHADWRMVFRFAAPAALAAVLGAWLLGQISGLEPLARYDLAGRECLVTWTKLVIAVLILGFAVVELSPGLDRLSFPVRYIPLGGAISGFFGGLSGHQGALRTAFLIRAGLAKEAFIGTMVISAIVVDLSRMLIYGLTFLPRDLSLLQNQQGLGLVAAGSLAAFAGAFLGSRLLGKITMRAIQNTVGVLLLLLALALGAGLV
ncbi:MAG: sulfite exporter TauE/SafE family protein [Desulfarculus sp.]|nr:MAG: sulfite exporter TauE/SafE family protein [Desulfarculus sp.]